MRRRTSIAAAALSALFALPSCRQNLDLEQVGTLAKTVASAQDALLAIPEDFYDSCVRQVGWSRGAVLSGAAGAAGPPAAAVSKRRRALLAGSSLGAVAAGGAPVFDVTTACAASSESSDQMAAMTTALTSYFAAIGKLADTGTVAGVGFDKLGAAASAIDPTSAFNASGKSAAVASSLDALASGIVSARAKAQLGPDIIAADALVGKLIDRLVSDRSNGEEDNVAAFYLRQLDFERFAMHAFYSNIGATPLGLQRLQAFDYYRDEAAEDARIDRRVAAVRTYESTLTKIRLAHADLVTAVRANDYTAAIDLAQQYTALIRPQLDMLRAAFR